MIKNQAKKRKLDTNRPSQLQTMPEGILAKTASYLTRRERTRSNDNGIRIPEIIIPFEKILETNAAFTQSEKFKSYINDPTVTLVEKVAIIADNTISDEVRKIPLKKDDIVLSIHALRQTDINFTPEEIEAILSYSDRGIIGTLIENTSIALSNAQIQEQWDKNEPFIRAMIIKSGRNEQLDISDTHRNQYNPNDFTARTAHSNTNTIHELPTLRNGDASYQELINMRREETEIRLASDRQELIASGINIKYQTSDFIILLETGLFDTEVEISSLHEIPLSAGQYERFLSNLATFMSARELAYNPQVLLEYMLENASPHVLAEQQIQRTTDN